MRSYFGQEIYLLVKLGFNFQEINEMTRIQKNFLIQSWLDENMSQEDREQEIKKQEWEEHLKNVGINPEKARF